MATLMATAPVDIGSPAVRAQHAAYMKKIVDTVDDLDNVLYEVVNEGGGKDWDWWVVDTMHKLETEKGKRHPVGLTGAGVETHGRDDGEPGGVDLALRPPVPLRSAGLGRQEGQRERHRPPVGARRHGHLGLEEPRLRGHNTLLMDSWDPIAGQPCPEVNWGPRPGYPNRDLNRRDDPTWEPVRRALGFTRQYADRMDLASMAPDNQLASTGYCLANPEREFLVYLPEGDRGGGGPLASAGPTQPSSGRIRKTAPSRWAERSKAENSESFAVPFVGAAVLYLKKESV